MASYYLGIDIGTFSSRGILLDDNFKIIADCSTPEFNVDTDIQGIGYVRKFSECFGVDRNGEFGESVLINEYLLVNRSKIL